MILLAVVQDFFQSVRNDYSFYLSESLLFTVFWMFFVPILYVGLGLMQKFCAEERTRIHLPVAMSVFTGCAALAHALLFACTVYMASALLFDHTYSIAGNLTYTFTNDSLVYLIVYGGAGFVTLRRETAWKQALKEEQEHSANVGQDNISVHSFDHSPAHSHQISSGITFNKPQVLSSELRHILVGTSKHRVAVPIDDIHAVCSAAPYVAVHTKNKEYLHAETLKSLHETLPPEQFVRIHKSTLVNLEAVVSSTSRFNGDYDILLANGQVLRLSRNYAKEFKEKFERLGHPQHTTSS
jgi:hypothetical protein